MSIVQFLFSFEGRVRRLHLWIFFLILSVLYGGLFSQFGHLHINFNGGWSHSQDWYGPGFWFIEHNPAFGLLGLVAVWMKLAVLVKRWHDRDKSGWWALITLIPVIGWLWQLIECGFLEGTPGANRYGPSPKSPEGALRT